MASLCRKAPLQRAQHPSGQQRPGLKVMPHAAHTQPPAQLKAQGIAQAPDQRGINRLHDEKTSMSKLQMKTGQIEKI
jgi:hypothetical protein